MDGKKLSKLAINYIETKYNGFVINVISASKAGIPDLIVCIDSKFFAFEIKGSNDREKPLQSMTLNMIYKAGGCGGYVYNLGDIDRIVLNKTNKPLKLPQIEL